MRDDEEQIEKRNQELLAKDNASLRSTSSNRQEWHWSVAQCIHMDAGRIKIRGIQLEHCYIRNVG